MQRLALAVIAIVAVAAAVVFVAGVVRSVWGEAGGTARIGHDGVQPVQKLSFVLLVALIVYVSLAGSG